MRHHWAKELNLISWNDHEPKYDLRDWSVDGAKMGKGVTLSKEELIGVRVNPYSAIDIPPSLDFPP